MTLASEIKNTKTYFLFCSITNKEKMETIFDQYKPELVFHAAAYKHVPMVESNPCAGVYNNIIGTYNVAKQAKLNKVESFVVFSGVSYPALLFSNTPLIFPLFFELMVVCFFVSFNSS